MATYETMIRMDENAFRAPDKMQPKVVRKPLGDLTNSSKPQAKGKAPVKNATGFKTREKIQPKVPRNPLRDLTNSTKPQAKEGSLKNSCSKVKLHTDIAGEGFCHDHRECIKAQNQGMSMEWFLETVGLQKEAFAPVAAAPEYHAELTVSEFKLEIPSEFPDDEITMLQTPASKSPVWSMDPKDSYFSDELEGEFLDFKLKENQF